MKKKYLVPIILGAVVGVAVVGLILLLEFGTVDESFTFFKIKK